MELVTLFYLIDEFCKEYEPTWQQSLLDSGVRQRRSRSRLSLAKYTDHNHIFSHEWLPHVQVVLRKGDTMCNVRGWLLSQSSQLYAFSRAYGRQCCAAWPLLTMAVWFVC